MARRHPIPKGDSTPKIKKYIDILKEAKKPQHYPNLPDLLKKYFASETLSFVFYKSQLDATFILAENANAVKVYLAATEQEGEQGTTTITPTLVIVPCFVNTGETSAQNKFPNRTDDGGDQYPVTFDTLSITSSDEFDMDTY